MPNIKSAKKRVELTKVYAARNQVAKTQLKTSLKKCEAAISEGGDASAAYNTAAQSIDIAVRKGLIHKNCAARKKSRLAKKANAAQ
ncbi:MAG: 30S ribosomal protein S20 [Oscillospiraceae bacterium]|nr:30S ribosomal protein S20 [Oscillospiraceae bacterium]